MRRGEGKRMPEMAFTQTPKVTPPSPAPSTHGGRGDNDPEVVFGHLVNPRRVNLGPVGARRPPHPAPLGAPPQGSHGSLIPPPLSGGGGARSATEGEFRRLFDRAQGMAQRPRSNARPQRHLPGDQRKAAQGVRRVGDRLRKVTSRILDLWSITISSRASPTPMPPCGGQP